MKVLEKLDKRMEAAGSLLCVGLDADFERLPKKFKAAKHVQFEFNKWVIEQTHEQVCAYKPNMAFYEATGEEGAYCLQATMDYLHEQHADIVAIGDAKRADIDNTNKGYVTALFDELGFDAVTLHPYLGLQALEPFLEREDKACIVLCKTSNPEAGQFQDLVDRETGMAMWEKVAVDVARENERRGNMMLVVGATYPEELRRAREVAGEMTLLVPGVGTQGGSVEEAVSAGLNSDKKGLIINASRSVIFAEDPAKAALGLKEEINRYR